MAENEGDRLQITDARLLVGLRSRDETAFEALFAAHWPTVYGILLRLVGSREEAEDLAQEVFVRLYRNPPDTHDRRGLAPWLYRVATNLGYNALRKGGREARRLERAQQWAVAEDSVGPNAVDPEDSALAREERLAVRAALSRLAEREQACLALRYSGLSYAEVAEVLGVRTSSVGTLLARAEASFRRAYEGLQEVPDGVRDGR